jgi:hypothetical protein
MTYFPYKVSDGCCYEFSFFHSTKIFRRTVGNRREFALSENALIWFQSENMLIKFLSV